MPITQELQQILQDIDARQDAAITAIAKGVEALRAEKASLVANVAALEGAIQAQSEEVRAAFAGVVASFQQNAENLESISNTFTQPQATQEEVAVELPEEVSLAQPIEEVTLELPEEVWTQLEEVSLAQPVD